MKMRTPNEIKSIDDEIDLFKEQDWNFLSVIETQDTNYEYFNDVRDTDFIKKSKLAYLSEYAMLGVFGIAIAIMSAVLVNMTGVFSSRDVSNLNTIATVEDSSRGLRRVSGGKAVSDEKFIELQSILNNYFKCVYAAKGYDELYDYCATTSTFADTYESTTSKIETLWDINDCKSRALRAFGKSCKINKVQQILEKDGVYYCYVKLSAPSDTDISEYIYLYSKEMIRDFNGVTSTEAGLYKSLLENIKYHPLPTSPSEYMITFVPSGDNYKIKDDTFLTSLCVNGYSEAVYKLDGIVGRNFSISK